MAAAITRIGRRATDRTKTARWFDQVLGNGGDPEPHPVASDSESRRAQL
jgi:hypothetical protein